MTPYQLHVQTWKDCEACPLSQKRNRIVLCRGKLPCDVLFIGEATGESENVAGQPFVGPAGALLDQIVERSLYHENLRRSIEQDGEGNPTPYPAVRVAFTNLVCCIPRDDDGRKLAEPDGDEIEACSPRLIEFVSIVSPKLIVCVGALSTKWVGEDARGLKHRIRFHEEIPTVSITHPAAILRAPYVQKGAMIQRSIVILSQAVEETCSS